MGVCMPMDSIIYLLKCWQGYRIPCHVRQTEVPNLAVGLSWQCK